MFSTAKRSKQSTTAVVATKLLNGVDLGARTAGKQDDPIYTVAPGKVLISKCDSGNPKSARRWDGAVNTIINVILAAVVAYMLSKYGM